MKRALWIVSVLALVVGFAHDAHAVLENGNRWGSPQYYMVPASELVAASATVTANACGGIKSIHTNGTVAVTTDTTNTFTAPSALYAGCCMDIINDGTGAITLDENTLFVSAGNIALGVGDTVRVCCNGTTWYEVGGSDN